MAFTKCTIYIAELDLNYTFSCPADSKIWWISSERDFNLHRTDLLCFCSTCCFLCNTAVLHLQYVYNGVLCCVGCTHLVDHCPNVYNSIKATSCPPQACTLHMHLLCDWRALVREWEFCISKELLQVSVNI